MAWQVLLHDEGIATQIGIMIDCPTAAAPSYSVLRSGPATLPTYNPSGFGSSAENENADTEGVRHGRHRDDFRRERQFARHINDRIDGEKNRRQRNQEAAKRGDPQPNLRPG